MNEKAGRLARELQQTRPFRSPAQEALIALLRTSDLLRRSLAAVVEPRGVTLQQYNVLRILRGAGEGGLPTLEIAERMIERTPGITRLLDRLETKGWVDRERCPRDRRQVLCHLTEGGRNLLAGLDAPVSEADERAVSILSREEQIELIRLLDTVRAGHRKPDDESTQELNEATYHSKEKPS